MNYVKEKEKQRLVLLLSFVCYPNPYELFSRMATVRAKVREQCVYVTGEIDVDS